MASTFKKISIASAIMMASVFASRLLGLLREAAIAWVGGATSQVDAYQVAFVIPEILNHVAATGFLSITFIPIFTRYTAKHQDEEGYQVFSNILNCAGGLLLVLILGAMVFAPYLVRMLAPGLTHAAGFSLAVEMTRIIIPAQFFFFAGGLLMAVQFSRERFLLPALAPLIYNLGIILGGVLLHPAMGMKGFAWGVLGGAFIGNFALQLWGAKRCGLTYSLVLNPRHKAFIRYILLTLPLMIGLTMTFSTEILMKFFGSFLAEGSIAAMNFALRIMFLLVGLFGQAVGMASYPYMAKLAADHQIDRLNTLINQTLKFILLVLPFSVLFMVLRQEIVQVLFQRGAFDLQATELTAGVLPFFLAGAFAFSAQTIVTRGYYAMQNTLFPAIFSTICVLLTLPVIYWAMQAMGVRGLALGLSVSVAATSLLLYESWNRKTGNPDKAGVYLFFFKLLLISGMLGILLSVFRDWLVQVIPGTGLLPNLMVCTATGLVFLAALTAAGRLFRITEIQELFKKVTRRTP